MVVFGWDVDMAEAGDGSERRIEQRDDCDVGAFVRTQGGDVIDCKVRDLSPQGARLEVDDASRVPDSFALMIPEVPGVHQKFEAKVIWRVKRAVGVSFA